MNPFLQQALKSLKGSMIAVFVFSFFINILTLSIPLYLLLIYTKVIPGQNTDTLLFLTLLILPAIITQAILEFVRRGIMTRIGTRFDNQVSGRLMESSISRSIHNHNTTTAAMGDLATLRGFISGSSVFPLLDIPWIPLFIWMMYLLHSWLGMLTTVGVITLFILGWLNERSSREKTRSIADTSSDLNRMARTYINHAEDIQAMGMQRRVATRWNHENSRVLESKYDARLVSNNYSVMARLVRTGFQIAVICAAAWLIVNQQTTAGATIAGILLFRRAASPVESSVRNWKSLLAARNALERISRYLNHVDKQADNAIHNLPAGRIDLQKLAVRHPGRQRASISRISLALKPGTLMTIGGPTGSGKSLLLKTLAAIMKPAAGEILIDGFDQSQWNSEQLGGAVGYLGQDPWLFPGTVAANIARLGKVDQNAVVLAARLSGAHDVIQKLPDGYQTVVENGGTNLSVGQRQYIALARALYGNPRFLFLDEPESSMDSVERKQFRILIRRLAKTGRTLVIATNAPSTHRLASVTGVIHERRLQTHQRSNRKRSEQASRSSGQLRREHTSSDPRSGKRSSSQKSGRRSASANVSTDTAKQRRRSTVTTTRPPASRDDKHGTPVQRVNGTSSAETGRKSAVPRSEQPGSAVQQRLRRKLTRYQLSGNQTNDR